MRAEAGVLGGEGKNYSSVLVLHCWPPLQAHWRAGVMRDEVDTGIRSSRQRQPYVRVQILSRRKGSHSSYEQLSYKVKYKGECVFVWQMVKFLPFTKHSVVIIPSHTHSYMGMCWVC